MIQTFPKGGVHPAEDKFAAGSPIKTLKVPEAVVIPLSQHIGAPAEPLVKKGDTVKTGQLIAQSKGFVSANIHSSVTGTVKKIDSEPDSSGYKRTAVVIDAVDDDWADGIDTDKTLKKNITAGADEIVRRTLDAGIVGLGGATFPSHIKLSLPKGKKADILIINGVECEPCLTSDHRLMLERGDELMVGIQLLMKALNVTRAFIGIENNKPDAIAHLSKLSADYEGIKVRPLKIKYPQGAEKQLIKALINREVPSGGLPVDVGTVVHNVGTAVAVYEAVQKNKPLIERVVTVTGRDMKEPSNFLVRIGTPVRTLIDAAGGLPDNTGKVVNGGPMMGKALNSLEVPVTKGTSGILLIPADKAARKPVVNCMRCAKCITVCPMGLEPHLLMPATEFGKWELAEEERILDCMECGSCSYICPSGRPLLDYIRLGKSTVSKIIRSRKQ
ncbi:MAG: electron transport complex subunit RsxC [Marinilabiliales bacterium]|nr:MAG: electron transport complex subunit RsxC [Marinilabiliales bacterium]